MFRALFAVAVLALLVISLKHMRLKAQWMTYSGSAQKSMIEWNTKSTQDQGSLLAVTATATTAGRPFYRSGRDFEMYIANVSKSLGRDVVVVDKTKLILADTVSSHVGNKFEEDKEGEVLKTIADGMPRAFVETSTDYPQGLDQTVVAMRDNAGTIVGAVILSSEKINK